MKKIKQKKVIKINIWDYLNISDVNDKLDDTIYPEAIACDIGYKCLAITKNGDCKIEATFNLDKV